MGKQEPQRKFKRNPILIILAVIFGLLFLSRIRTINSTPEMISHRQVLEGELKKP